MNAALDRHPLECDRDRYLRRTVAMELVDLDQATTVFRAKALTGDVRAGALLVKIAERRATLLGLNAPIGHAVRVVSHAPADQPSSLDRIRAALDRVMRDGKRDGAGNPGDLEPPRADGGEDRDRVNYI